MLYGRDVAGVFDVQWLAECSVAALREALRAVAPDLSGYPLTVPGPTAKEDPVWQSGATIVDERFVVKFAWSRPAALGLVHEIDVLTALTAEPRVPFLPEVVTSSTDPVLLITRRVPGMSLFEVVDSIDRDRAGWQLACFLAVLHQPATRERAEAAVGGITDARFPPATTRVLRDRFGNWVRPGQRELVMRWCDWTDGVLGSPAPAVLVQRAHRPRRHPVAQRSRHPPGGPQDAAGVGRRPSRPLPCPRHRSAGVTAYGKSSYRITRSSRWMTSRSYSWPSLLASQRVDRPIRPGISFAS